MSDNKTQPTPPPTPAAKTSAVPLKKETVRITLRARPGAGVTQPKELTTPVPSVGTSPVPSVTGSVPTGTSRVSVSAPRTATSPVTPAPISKSTSPIQLPSAPLPPPAARPSTSPVQIPPPAIPAPSAPGRTTAYVNLNEAPAAPAPPAPSIPRPAGGPPAPPGRPQISPTVPMAKAPGGPPVAPGAPRAPLPAATVPLGKAPSPPRPPGAPPAPGAKVEAGATTVPLASKSGVPNKPPGAAPAARVGGAPPVGPGATSQLPKATVKLGQTAPMSRGTTTGPAVSSTPRPAADFEEEVEHDPETGLVPLAILSVVVAAALCLVNLFMNDKFQVYAAPSDITHYVFPSAPDEQAWEAPGHSFSETLKAQTRDIQ